MPVIRILTILIAACGGALCADEFPLERLLFSLMEANDKVVVQYSVNACIGPGPECTLVLEGAKPTKLRVFEPTHSLQIPKVVLTYGPAPEGLLAQMDTLIKYHRRHTTRTGSTYYVQLAFLWYSKGKLLRKEVFEDGSDRKPPFSIWDYVLHLRAKLSTEKYRELLLSDDPFVQAWAIRALDPKSRTTGLEN